MIWSGLLWQSWWKFCFSAMINKVIKSILGKPPPETHFRQKPWKYWLPLLICIQILHWNSIAIIKDFIIISEWNGFGTILKVWRSISFLFLNSWNSSPDEDVLEAFIVAAINDKVHQTVDDNQKVIDWCWTDEPSGWNEITFTNHQFVDVKELV